MQPIDSTKTYAYGTSKNIIHVKEKLNVYKMYTKRFYTECIPHFDKLLYTFCIQNLAGIVVLILYIKCIQKFSKMCIHFVYILCTSVVYILYNFSIQNLYKVSMWECCGIYECLRLPGKTTGYLQNVIQIILMSHISVELKTNFTKLQFHDKNLHFLNLFSYNLVF